MLHENDHDMAIRRNEDDQDDDEYSHSDQEHQDPEAMKEQREAIAKRETRIVRGFRVFVILLLIISTLLSAMFVHRYLDNSEQEEFQKEFASDANKVLSSIGKSIDSTLGAIDALALAAVSLARETGQEWPFVTIPDWYGK